MRLAEDDDSITLPNYKLIAYRLRVSRSDWHCKVGCVESYRSLNLAWSFGVMLEGFAGFQAPGYH